MDGITLQDRINRGMGTAARRIGSIYSVYRPRDVSPPIKPASRIIKLFAAFGAGTQSFKGTLGYGGQTWVGTFDAAYTMPGDYLCGCSATYFIASQKPLLPIQCVRANAIITISRTANISTTPYSGFVIESATPILCSWPARLWVLHAATRGAPPESKFGTWVILLPTLPICPQVEDVITDDMGRSYSIAAAEKSDLGWRFLARQIDG